MLRAGRASGWGSAGRRKTPGGAARRTGAVRAGWCFVLALLAGCETAVEPFKPGERYFSVFGFLDAGADSQFVRVSPLRDSIAVGPGPIDAVVTLENVATGAVATFADSLFSLGGGLAYNFWADVPVAHGATYRLRVARSDGVVSTATVTLPDAFDEPSLVLGRSENFLPEDWAFTVKVGSDLPLADVKFFYTLRDHDTGQVFTHQRSYREEIAPIADGQVVHFIPYDDLYREDFPVQCPLVLDVRVVVAAAGSDWPDAGIDLETLARPDVVSNVENGVGFLGALSSKTFTSGTHPQLALLSQTLASLHGLCLQCAAGSRDYRCLF